MTDVLNVKPAEPSTWNPATRLGNSPGSLAPSTGVIEMSASPDRALDAICGFSESGGSQIQGPYEEYFDRSGYQPTPPNSIQLSRLKNSSTKNQ